MKCGYCIGIGIEVDQTMDDDVEETEAKVFKVNILDTQQERFYEKKHLEEVTEHLPVHLKELYRRSTVNLNLQQSIQLAKLLQKFEDIFATSDLDIGLFNGDIKHRIDTQDSHPIRQRMRRTPIGFEKEEEEHLQELLQKGIIEPSSSEWASPPVLVR